MIQSEEGPPRAARFGSRVLTLAFATAAAQTILLISSPLLTRIFTPAQYGLFSLATSVGTVLAAIATLRFEYAIPSAGSDSKASSIARGALVIAATFLLGVGLVVAAGTLLLLARGEGQRGWQFAVLAAWSLSIAGGIVGYQVASFWAVRQHSFKRLAVSRFSISLTQVALQVGGGIAGAGAMALAGGYIASQVMGASVLAKDVARRGIHFGQTRVRSIIRELRPYATYSMPAALLNVASAQLPILILAGLGSQVVGWTGLAIRVLQAPIQLVGQAIGQVFLGGLSDRDSSRIAITALRIFELGVRYGLVPATLLLVFAPEGFRFIFGQDWREAGVYAQWLVPWLFLVLLTSPVSTIIYPLGLQHFELIFQSALFIARLVVLLFGVYVHSPLISIAGFGIASALFWAGYTAVIIRHAKRRCDFRFSPGRFGLAFAGGGALIAGSALPIDAQLKLAIGGFVTLLSLSIMVAQDAQRIRAWFA